MSEAKAQRDRASHSLKQIETEMKKQGSDWEPRQLNKKINLEVNTPNGRVTFQIVGNLTDDVLELFKEVASQGGKTSISIKHAPNQLDVQSIINEIKLNLELFTYRLISNRFYS